MSVPRAVGKTLYNFPKLDLLSTEGAVLPEAYKKFYKEWKLTQPAPVHYIPPAAEWIRDDSTGEVKRTINVPIPVKYVLESHKGIWGGEGVIKGFQKRTPTKARVPHFWVPNLKKSVVYSEILNLRLETVVTDRTIELIVEHHGFDNYILKTKACDLQSSLALKIKKKMLHALYHKTLYPDDPLKREEVFEKYKHFLEAYTKDDIEWYGLTFDEAMTKFKKEEAASNRPKPMKYDLRLKYIEYLKTKDQQKEEEESSSSTSWITKLNPFARKE